MFDFEPILRLRFWNVFRIPVAVRMSELSSDTGCCGDGSSVTEFAIPCGGLSVDVCFDIRAIFSALALAASCVACLSACCCLRIRSTNGRSA